MTEEMEVVGSDQDVIAEKLSDVMTPGYQVEFSPDEAVTAGAFVESALSEEDALESSLVLEEGEDTNG